MLLERSGINCLYFHPLSMLSLIAAFAGMTKKDNGNDINRWSFIYFCHLFYVCHFSESCNPVFENPNAIALPVIIADISIIISINHSSIKWVKPANSIKTTRGQTRPCLRRTKGRASRAANHRRVLHWEYPSIYLQLPGRRYIHSPGTCVSLLQSYQAID